MHEPRNKLKPGRPEDDKEGGQALLPRRTGHSDANRDGVAALTRLRLQVPKKWSSSRNHAQRRFISSKRRRPATESRRSGRAQQHSRKGNDLLGFELGGSRLAEQKDKKKRWKVEGAAGARALVFVLFSFFLLVFECHVRRHRTCVAVCEPCGKELRPSLSFVHP